MAPSMLTLAAAALTTIAFTIASLYASPSLPSASPKQPPDPRRPRAEDDANIQFREGFRTLAARSEKNHNGRPRRHVGQREDGLHRHERLLETQTYSCACQKLIAYPLHRRRVRLEGGDEPVAQRHGQRARKHEGGTVYAKIVNAPVKIPAPPTPATARPRMKARLVGATPQMRLPSSKMATAEINTVFMFQKV
ncbi:unnamed protein product [Parascedosporium putredinis]|uniref:Uncharacterized protein n=1 Tax=Parascedosporium putredinis TaxID=1442378 RepID=A0A9P1H514_9PEZI|nr:unnamed protein product [Parascedosporium putredinis]CAI7997395.1 unnamed protein product [Parascedosporium putredinis]